jgi:hypothetical protein
MMYFGSLSDSISHSAQIRVLLVYCGMGGMLLDQWMVNLLTTDNHPYLRYFGGGCSIV